MPASLLYNDKCSVSLNKQRFRCQKHVSIVWKIKLMNLWIRRMTYPNSNTKENYLYFLSFLGFELITVFLTGICLPCLLVCCVSCALLVLESSRITAAGFQLVKVKWFFLNPLYCIILGFLLSIFVAFQSDKTIRS